MMRSFLPIVFASICALSKALEPDWEIGIGFDLKYSYGTAAISYPNGTRAVLALVEGSDEYKSVMMKFSDWQNQHPAPPYNEIGDMWGDMWRQKLRRFWKSIGLPASTDVGHLSTLIRSLKEEAEAQLGFEIKAATASVPYYPALYDEDIYDAFEYAGLEYLRTTTGMVSGHYLTYDPSAAIAGHDLGLCEDFRNASKCFADGSLHGTYYVVHYTKEDIQAYHFQIYDEGVYWGIMRSFQSFTLGSKARCEAPDEKAYWDAVEELLLEPLIETPWAVPTRIILAGESIKDKGFREKFESIMVGYFWDKLPFILDADPEFVLAKGVAELARRQRYMEQLPRPHRVSTSGIAHGTGQGGQMPIEL